jgi:aminoglycoside/choline kinase family phosphotransferase
MGASVRYALEWSDASRPNVASVVCKFASPDSTSRATGLTLRTYEVEVNFYRLLARTVDIRTPGCHFADIDLATGEFVLVMEDLAPAAQGNQMVGCTTAQAALALDELAKLHAPRWGDQRLAALPWLNRNTPDALATSSLMLPALLPGFLERYAARLAPEHVDVAERLMAALAGWFADREPPFVIQHGDYRVDNMLFATAAGGPPLTVVDWQTAVWGMPLADVAYFLGASLPTAARRAEERTLVRQYYDAVTARGACGLDWERCWRDYRKFTFAGVLMAICASMLVVQTKRGDEMFLTMARRHATHVLDVDALELLAA